MNMNELKGNCLSLSLWVRILYMILFYIVSKIVMLLVLLVTIVQLLSKLLTGDVIQPLWKFSSQLNEYMLHICHFLTFVREEKPFPFSKWPSERVVDESSSEETI